MANRVRNRRGQFVTVEEKAREDAEYAAKRAWSNLEVVKEFDDGKKLVQVTDPEDLTKWGKEMGHCGGSHYKWTTIENIWHFLTVLDEHGKVHCTWHLKDKEWFKKAHPDDDYAKGMSEWYTGPHEMGLKYTKSTTYDRDYSVDYNYAEGKYVGTPCHGVLDGKEVVLMTRRADAKWQVYFDAWWEEVKVEQQENAVA